MLPELQTWAYDILTAIIEIETFLSDKAEFAVYQSDLKTKRAIERNLEIIGEAMNKMLKKDPLLHFTDARKIVDTRNRIIHSYNNVSDEIIWNIVMVSLPKLKAEVKDYLSY